MRDYEDGEVLTGPVPAKLPQLPRRNREEEIHLRRARHGELIPGLREGKGRVVVQALDELQGSGWTSPFGCNPAE